jgi:hypothetical protein
LNFRICKIWNDIPIFKHLLASEKAGSIDFRHALRMKNVNKMIFLFTAKWYRSLHPAVQAPRRKTSPGTSRNARPSTPEQQTEAPGHDKACTEFPTLLRTRHRSTPEFAHPISSQRFPQNFRKGIFDILNGKISSAFT